MITKPLSAIVPATPLCALLTFWAATPCAFASDDAQDQPLLSLRAASALSVSALHQDATPELVELEAHSKWRAELTAWIWLMGVEGDIGLGDRVSNVSASILDIIEDSDSLFSLSGRLEFGYDRFGAFVDATYADIAANDQSGPLGVANIDVSIEQTIIDYGLMFRVGEWEGTGSSAGNRRKLTLDAYAGGRYIRMTAGLDPVNVASRSQTRDWMDPIVGAKVVLPLGEKWSLSLNGDVGGFGVESDLTWSATGVFGYDFSLFDLPTSAFFGYRAMGWDYSTGSGADEFKLDLVLHGILLGFSLQF